jgi:hypothetical protein
MSANPPLADFGYDFGPLEEVTPAPQILSAEQMRELGRETIEEFKPKTGRHAGPQRSYLDGWALRYWRSQVGIERDRLRAGKARHRAHRKPFPVMEPAGDPK